MAIQHLKQIGKVKKHFFFFHFKKTEKLGKWLPHKLTVNKKKNNHSEVLSFILCNSKEPFLEEL